MDKNISSFYCCFDIDKWFALSGQIEDNVGIMTQLLPWKVNNLFKNSELRLLIGSKMVLLWLEMR